MIRRTLLRGFGRLPKPVRRFVIRRAAPTWTAGAVAILERADGRWLMVSPVYRKGWSLPGTIAVTGDPWIVYDSTLRRIDAIFRAELVDDIDLDAIQVQTPELDGLGWFEPTAPPEIEEETEDVLVLVRRVNEGGPSVLWR